MFSVYHGGGRLQVVMEGRRGSTVGGGLTSAVPNASGEGAGPTQGSPRVPARLLDYAVRAAVPAGHRSVALLGTYSAELVTIEAEAEPGGRTRGQGGRSYPSPSRAASGSRTDRMATR
jgi:hypothetical protein